MDSRYQAFAKQLVEYCVGVKPGELAIIHATDNAPIEFIEAIIDAVRAAKGNVADIWWDNQRLERKLRMQMDPHQERVMSLGRLVQACAMDVNIVIRGFDNIYASADVPADNMKMLSAGVAKQARDQRIDHTRWILTRMWSQAMAQMAGMSHEAFTDYYFQTVLLNYQAMSDAMTPLYDLVTRGRTVKIEGPGNTNLTFSIDGIGAMKCDGQRNIPDGEVYTAPVRDSMDGIVEYNTVTVTSEGQRFENVKFIVQKGRIVSAHCGSGDVGRLNQFLDTDPGARYFGEFAFGFNPYILTPIGETLFDEKIAGSFHLTPGQCYTGTPAANGNNSGIHWDIVSIQRKEFGGGRIWIDNTLVREDGLFVPEELQGLNPDALMAA